MDDYSSKIEHTVLGPETTRNDVFDVMEIADRNRMRACIPPCYVKEASKKFPLVDISTVVGFPHGQSVSTIKCEEATQAVADGASEIDMVANIGFLRDGDFEPVQEDIEAVVDAVGELVKVIIEAPLLTDSEKHRICEIASKSGADFVKTATGFSNGGATAEDVRLMSEYLPVKASGGIDSGEKAIEMFEAGAERIGASKGHIIIDELVGRI